MDRAKLKLMVRNLELLVDDIKAEVYSDKNSYLTYESYKKLRDENGNFLTYDEIQQDDDGFPD